MRPSLEYSGLGVFFRDTLMNYYTELLDSYSKLKRRSLKLIAEEDTAPQEEELDPNRVQVNNDQEFIAALSTNVAMGAEVPITNQSGRKATIKIQDQKLNIRVFAGTERFVVGRIVNGQPALAPQPDPGGYYTPGYQKLQAWYQEAPKGETKEGEGKGKEKEQPITQEQLDAMAQEQRDAYYNEQLAVDVSAWNETPEEKPFRSEWTNPNTQGNFTRMDESFTEQLQESTQITGEEKVQAFELYKKAMTTLANIQNPNKEFSDTDIRGLREVAPYITLYNDRLLLQVGEQEVAVGAHDLEGTEGGTVFASRLYDQFNKEIEKINKDVGENIDPEAIIPTLAKREDPDGDNPALRGTANESVKVIMGNFLAMAGAQNTEGKQFYHQKIIEEWEKLTEKRSPEKVAKLFGLGLGQDQLDTLFSMESKEYVDSIRSFLTKHRGMDEEKVESLLGNLSSDGQKALAFSIALDMHATKTFFGDVSPIGAVKLGDSKEYANLGEKADVQYVFRSKEDIQKIQENIKKITKGKKLPANAFKTMKASEVFKEELPQGVNPDDEVTVLRAEIKTLNDGSSKITYGQMNAANYISTLGGIGDNVAEQTFAKKIQTTIENKFKGDTAKSRKVLSTLSDMLFSGKMSLTSAKTTILKNLEPKMRAKVKGMLTKAETPAAKKAILANASIRGALLGNMGQNSKNALAAQVFASCMSSNENLARLTFQMRENDVNIKDDFAIKNELINGLSDGTYKVEAAKSSGYIYIRDKSGKPMYVAEWNTDGTSLRCRSMSPRESTKLGESTFHSFLLGQAKLIKELLANS